MGRSAHLKQQNAASGSNDCTLEYDDAPRCFSNQARRLTRRHGHLVSALNCIRPYDPIVFVSNLDRHLGSVSYALDWRANHLP